MPPAAPTGLSATGGTGSISAHLDREHRERPRRLQRLSLDDDAGAHDRHAAQRRDPARRRGHTPTRPRRPARRTTTSSRPWTSPTTSRWRRPTPRRRPAARARTRPLQLNGSSQYVTFGAAPALNASNFTLELWFQRTGAGVGTTTGTGGIASAIPLVTKGRAEAETPGQPQHGLLPRHRRVDRDARRRLRGHRERHEPPGHAARPP